VTEAGIVNVEERRAREDSVREAVVPSRFAACHVGGLSRSGSV